MPDPRPRRSRLRRRTAVALAATTATVLAPVGTGPAGATYRGEVGRIFFGAFFSRMPHNAELFSVGADGTGLLRLTDTPATMEICPALSPDGQHVAYCSGIGSQGRFEIWRMRPDGTQREQLTSLGGFAIFPDWSPDMTRIAFTSGPDAASTRIAVLDLAAPPGTPQVTPLTTPPAGHRDSLPAWRPHGERIVFVRDRMGQDAAGRPVPVASQLWTLDLRSGRERQLTSDPSIKGQVPDWNPDGSKIAYSADGDIHVVNVAGSQHRNLTRTPDADEFGPAWSPDGRRIAFTGTGWAVPPGERYVQVMDADGSDRRVLRETPGLRQAVPGWQPLPRR